MSKTIQIKKKPAAPWYVAGAVWVAGALALPVYQLWALGLVAVASLAALAAAFKLCPPVIETKEMPISPAGRTRTRCSDRSTPTATACGCWTSASPTTPAAPPAAGWWAPATAS